ncbi:unnamed protein product [Symbiodinium pilosum]|uniref:Outer dense fiber protein 3 n=1 Tax=Symbiodinium pilosum TaxID=2952 RepID=A0A812U629_SYMPI|nr:unnamed protein product [Symbiodinium pilosum]
MPRRRDQPGPGHYEIPHFLSQSTRGASLKIGNRVGNQSELFPGPTDYVSPSGCPTEKKSKHIRFGTAKRFGRTGEDTPGPCQYTPHNPTATSERRSIGERTHMKLPGVADATPGPGAYTPLKAAVRSPGTAFHRGSPRSFTTPLIEGPGPAAYMTDKDSKLAANSNGFGYGPRLQGLSDDNTPGPGSYSWDLKPYGPKISMTPRREYE